MQMGFSFVSIRVSWLKVFGSGFAGLGLCFSRLAREQNPEGAGQFPFTKKHI